MEKYPYNTQIIKMIIDNMYDPESTDSLGNTPLHYVSKYDNNTEKKYTESR